MDSMEGLEQLAQRSTGPGPSRLKTLAGRDPIGRHRIGRV